MVSQNYTLLYQGVKYFWHESKAEREIKQHKLSTEPTRKVEMESFHLVPLVAWCSVFQSKTFIPLGEYPEEIASPSSYVLC